MAIAELSDAALHSELDAAFERRRLDDALIVRLAAVVADRSRTELGADGLARRNGNSNAADFVAWIGKISHGEAAKLCRVGAATAPRVSLIGEKFPPVFETLAAAVDSGAVTVDAASHIVMHLDIARPRAAVDDLLAAERALVAFASGVPADDVRRLAIRWRDALDTDGIEPREAELVAGRNIKRFMLPNGLKRYQLDADPLSSAYLDAAVDAEIAASFRKVRFEDPDAGPDEETPTEDPRTTGQRGLDALVDMVKHGLSCENTTPALASATVMVRMTLDSLLTGLGEAELIGQHEPISAGAARRLAAGAEIIPVVLGGGSEILDFGRARRLFSKAQRQAMIERDGGCPCGCERLPVYLEAHHADWWSRDRGRTDLQRGVMLCTRAHTMVHQYGWAIRFHDDLPYLIPPPTIDPKRTPRRRARPPMIRRE